MEAKQNKNLWIRNKKNFSPYSKLVEYIKDNYNDKYDFIINRIENLYDQNIFILKRWDLETYLGMRQKWLQETVVFCHRYLQARLKNKKLNIHREEIFDILRKIFG